MDKRFTDMRSFILREARLDALNPQRSELSRLIHAATAKTFPALWRAVQAQKKAK